MLENWNEVFTLPSTNPNKPAEYTYEMIFRFIHDNLLIFVKEECDFCKKFFAADFTGINSFFLKQKLRIVKTKENIPSKFPNIID